MAVGRSRISESGPAVALVRMGHLARALASDSASGIWLAMSWLILGCAILGLGVHPADAVHALTTGAVGAMTLAIMTRASLGHTGQPRHAGPVTILIYVLVNLGAVLRVFGPATALSTPLVLGLSAMAWSGAYLLFALVYGKYLLRPSLDGE